MKLVRTLVLGFLPQSLAFAYGRGSPGLGKRRARVQARPCVQGCGCISDFDTVDEIARLTAWISFSFIYCINGIQKDVDMRLARDSTVTPITPQPTPTTAKTNNCKDKGGPCDCDYIQDKSSDEYGRSPRRINQPIMESYLTSLIRYRQCLTNPDCERCYFTATWAPPPTPPTTPTTLQSSSKSLISITVTIPLTPTPIQPPSSSSSVISSSTSQTTTTGAPRLPDNCYIGGPCDCSLIPDKKSPDYVRCISNPACEHCFLNNNTLTTRSSTLVTQLTTLDMTSISSTAQGTA
ncbi:unnamed protein product [Clonostachys rosea]|uniref:Uncharacterized protein n=1 Tax=Bionectria ochroleuca TaxID=29856 RepID=A0ABY6UWP8_BIOOC|nr:unnamed protein product [Clonostachys rosea]